MRTKWLVTFPRPTKTSKTGETAFSTLPLSFCEAEIPKSDCEKINSTVEIQYKDNGVGISGDLIYKNGLRNTASRIEAIGGTITFDTKIEKGLKVNLSFPAS